MSNGQKLSIANAKQISLIDYLSSLGHRPSRIRGAKYWYLSPLRNERTASFMADNLTNRWVDWGDGRYGDIIDFGVRYHNCSVQEFLQRLNDPSLAASRPMFIPENNKKNDSSRIMIKQVGIIQSFPLLHYLRQRRIPYETAQRFCNEIKYEVNKKEFYSIGFKNDLGGYELRNRYFKGSNAPKAVTTFDNGKKQVSVFEGFFDFLTSEMMFGSVTENTKNASQSGSNNSNHSETNNVTQSGSNNSNQSDSKNITQSDSSNSNQSDSNVTQSGSSNSNQSDSNILVLNSLSFFEQSRSFMEKHELINLFLDNNRAGENYTKYALSLSPKYQDKSDLYNGYDDLNEWAQNIGKSPHLSSGRHFP